MASFRRPMSLVPRDEAIHNGETFSVSSSSPKSSHPQNYYVSGWRLTTMFGSVHFFELLSRIRELALGIFLQRPRTIDRSKSKGQAWKRAFFHFFLCFMVGLFVGLTPFISVNLSSNIVSEHQALSSETSPPDGSISPNFDTGTKRGSLLEKSNLSPEMENGPREGKSDDFLAPSPVTDSDSGDRKLLIVVTPTYNRAFQAYYLNRMAHTLRLVQPPLLWIVVEMFNQSTETDEILRRSGVMYRHLVCKKNLTSTKDRGIHQRNAALAHIEKHYLDGIVYFADDDNVYTVDLFEKMRRIRRFGTWPVAMLMESKNKAIMEGPVCNGSQVIGWHTNERSKRTRRFHVDMSGFAFNSTILWDTKRWRRPTPESIRQLDTVKEGLQETTFIEQVVEDESQMEGLPNECSWIMVWHLHLEAPQLTYPQSWFTQKNLDVVVPL